MLLPLTSGAQGIITTIAGGGWGGDGVLATDSHLSQVNDVLVDTNGNVYIAEETAIRKIDAQTQIISLYAGSYQGGIGCDGCPATSAKLSHANAIAFDKQGNLYIADYGHGRIRKVDAVTGIMTTYAGNSTLGYSGDGGPATSAQLRKPLDIAFDADDNLYIADRYYHIRRVDRQTGIITTIAGNGVLGSWNNGDDVSNVQIGGIGGICFDKQGNLYVADGDNRRIGKIDQQGIITTYCGTGAFGNSGNGIPAIDAETRASSKIRVDKNDNVYVLDGYVRRINHLNGIIEIVAGTASSGFSGDGGPALQAQLHNPVSVFADQNGDLLIADQLNYRIRKITGVVSINDPKSPSDFVLYPNPSNGVVYIASSESVKKVEARNITGQLVAVLKLIDNPTRLDLSNQPSGVYIISVFGDSGVTSKKLVINH